MTKRDKTYNQLSPDDIHQSYPDTCAIKAQQIILESHGISISEDELIQESIDNGWYRPGSGTLVNNVGNLLESHGLEVEKFYNGTLEDLANGLSNGKQIIIGVDSGELWHPGLYEEFEDLILGPHADHALLVSGISVDPLTAETQISLTDPGTGEIFSTYSMDEFQDAWDDSNNFMLLV